MASLGLQTQAVGRLFDAVARATARRERAARTLQRQAGAPALLVGAQHTGADRVLALAELVGDRASAVVDDVEARGHRLRATEQLHGVVTIAARAVGGRDADLGQLTVEQVASVRR